MCVLSGWGRWGSPVGTVPVLSRVGLTASPLELRGGRVQSSFVKRGSEPDLCSITQLTAT